LRRHFVRVFAQSHESNVDEPARAEVIRVFLELFLQDGNRPPRTPLDFMKRGWLKREKA